MARVQYGVIVTELKGKIGGQVFQGGNNSKVLRNNTYKKGTSSAARQAANRLITTASIVWRSLSAAEIATWETAKLTWAFSNKFGEPYYGTAYQVFIAYNAGLAVIQFGQTTTANAPVSAEAITGLQVAADDTNVMDLSFDAITTVQQILVAYMSAPTTANKSPNNIRYRKIGVVNTDQFNVVDLSAAYDAIYGGRQDGNVIYYYVEIRVNAYPRAVLRQYGNFTIL